MRDRSRARAGRYAQERYERGLRAYRRRIRWPLLVVVVPMFVLVLVILFWRGIEWWSFIAGCVGASAAALVSVIRDDVPHHVAMWRRGAEGERKTEKALRPLERAGWTVEHDVQRDGRANLDHVVIGKAGTFLLETKNVGGTITFEGGVLVARQYDDPDEVYRYATLTSRMRGAAAELSDRLQSETGRRPWVTPVVVIWGDFDSEPTEHDGVVYLPGGRLATWLQSPDADAAAAARRLRQSAEESA